MPEAAQSNPSVSVILPARDEEANIAAAVESLAVYFYPGMFLFAALMVSSWFAHRVRGRVVWKGRAYDPETLGK